MIVVEEEKVERTMRVVHEEPNERECWSEEKEPGHREDHCVEAGL